MKGSRAGSKAGIAMRIFPAVARSKPRPPGHLPTGSSPAQSPQESYAVDGPRIVVRASRGPERLDCRTRPGCTVGDRGYGLPQHCSAAPGCTMTEHGQTTEGYTPTGRLERLAAGTDGGNQIGLSRTGTVGWPAKAKGLACHLIRLRLAVPAKAHVEAPDAAGPSPSLGVPNDRAWFRPIARRPQAQSWGFFSSQGLAAPGRVTTRQTSSKTVPLGRFHDRDRTVYRVLVHWHNKPCRRPRRQTRHQSRSERVIRLLV